MQQVLEEYMMKEMVRLYKKSLAILKFHFSLDGYKVDVFTKFGYNKIII